MNCCTYECNEGRDCHVRSSRLEQKEGGKTVDTEPEPKEQDGYTLGCWIAYGIALAVFLSAVVMTWVVYPNFPQ